MQLKMKTVTGRACLAKCTVRSCGGVAGGASEQLHPPARDPQAEEVSHALLDRPRPHPIHDGIEYGQHHHVEVGQQVEDMSGDLVAEAVR